MIKPSPHYHPDTQSFDKRAAAKEVQNCLIEDGFPSRGVTIDKDGSHYRVYLPAISDMWNPIDNSAEAWSNEVQRLKDKLNG